MEDLQSIKKMVDDLATAVEVLAKKYKEQSELFSSFQKQVSESFLKIDDILGKIENSLKNGVESNSGKCEIFLDNEAKQLLKQILNS